MSKEQTQELIGKLLPEGVERDAIHIAVAPVIAGGHIYSGDKVTVIFDGKNYIAFDAEYGEYKGKDNVIGIADPFLNESIDKGDRFYVFLFPNTVTGLTHKWEHPAFNDVKPKKTDAENWLYTFAMNWGIDYNEMIAAATSKPDEYGNYITAYGNDLHSKNELGNDYYEFWKNIELLTGKKYDEEHRDKVRWSCSC